MQPKCNALFLVTGILDHFYSVATQHGHTCIKEFHPSLTQFSEVLHRHYKPSRTVDAEGQRKDIAGSDIMKLKVTQ